MAVWKKILVSGSNISQLANDVGYVINGGSGYVLNGAFTGSFSGSGVFPELTDGNGITNFTYNSSGTATISVDADGTTIAATEGNGSQIGVVDAGITQLQIASGSIFTGHIVNDQVTAAKLDDVFTNNGGVAGTFGSSTLVPILDIDSQGRITSASLASISTTLSIAGDSGTDTVSLIDGTLTFEGTPGIVTTVTNDKVTFDIAGNIVSGSSIGTTTTQGQVVQIINGQSGSAVTIKDLGTADSPTFAGLTVTGNTTVDGDLTVNGSVTTLNTTNTEIKDKFILLNSGSATTTDESGIIFGGANGTAGNGTALIWNGDYNSNDGRLAIANNVNHDATAATVSYYVGGVFDGTANDAATAQADHRGNIRVDSSDDIWIYV